jgi:DNA polymerase-3 subunit delta'
MSSVVWPDEAAGCPAAAALEKALAQGRLGHALLLISENLSTADGAAQSLARAFLRTNALPHGDYVFAEPADKQRQIGVEPMRAIREFLQKGSLSGTKVAHISQADRLNVSAANLFLKILEEPPADTYILMTTTEPASVLPTLLSRAMRFRFPSGGAAQTGEIATWGSDFRQLLLRPRGALAAAALIDRAGRTLSKLEEEDESDAPEDKDIAEARAAARLKAQKKEFFAVMEEEVLEAYKERPVPSVRLRQALKAIERSYRLTEFNLNTAAAIEAAVLGAAEALGESRLGKL